LTPFLDQSDWWGKKTSEGKVDARVLHDPENLYVRVTVEGFPAKGTKVFDTFSSPLRRGGERAGRGVTIYLSPQHGQPPWYCFEFCRSGYGYDAKENDRDWNPSPAWKVISKTVDDKWQFTGAIPFRALDTDTAKTKALGLKLIVQVAKNEIYIWPPVSTADRFLMYGAERCAPQNANPACYARLQLP